MSSDNEASQLRSSMQYNTAHFFEEVASDGFPPGVGGGGC